MASERRVLASFVRPALELIRAEVRNRNLPPDHFGIERATWDESALLTLVGSFAEWHVHRIDKLVAKIDAYGNVDPMIQRNLRYFFVDEQRKADPVGYAVYDNVRGAVTEAIAEGWLRACGGASADAAARSPSSADLEVAGGPREAERSPVHVVEAVLRGLPEWSDVVKEVGRRSDATRRRLKEVFRALIRQGVERWRSGDVVEVLRGPARAVALQGWAPRQTGYEDGVGREAVPTLVVDGLEELDGVWALRDRLLRMEADLEALPLSAGVKRAVARLLRELAYLSQTQERVRQSELGRRLGIPRSTMSDYMGTIRTLWEENERSSEPSPKPPLPVGEGRDG